MRNRIAYLASAFIMVIASSAVSAEDMLPEYRPGVANEAQVQFPDVSKATRPQGIFKPSRFVVMVTPGRKKSEVYSLLDVPHFREGLFGVRTWNYIINFYTGTANEYRQCQYQIKFDKNYRVASTWWKNQECADLFDKELSFKNDSIYQGNDNPSPNISSIKSYTFTFDFNKSSITSAGRDVINQVLQDVSNGTFSRIVVVGFTDTVGTTKYNDNLAARRAAVVSAEIARELSAKGSPLQSNVYSRAGRELAVGTGLDVREERNRRVTIELY